MYNSFFKNDSEQLNKNWPYKPTHLLLRSSNSLCIVILCSLSCRICCWYASEDKQQHKHRDFLYLRLTKLHHFQYQNLRFPCIMEEQNIHQVCRWIKHKIETVFHFSLWAYFDCLWFFDPGEKLTLLAFFGSRSPSGSNFTFIFANQTWLVLFCATGSKLNTTSFSLGQNE